MGPAAFALAHAVGFIPACMAGVLSGLVVISRIVPWVSIGGRLVHSFLGGACGLLSTVLVLDYPD